MTSFLCSPLARVNYLYQYEYFNENILIYIDITLGKDSPNL